MFSAISITKVEKLQKMQSVAWLVRSFLAAIL